MRTIRSIICLLPLILPTLANAQIEIEDGLCNANNRDQQECVLLLLDDIKRFLNSPEMKADRYLTLSRIKSPTARFTHYQCERGIQHQQGITVIVDDAYVGEECLVSADIPDKGGMRWFYSERVRKVECASKLREALEMLGESGYLCRDSSKSQKTAHHNM